MRLLFSMGLAIALAACAATPGGFAISAGRYMHIKHPATDAVVFQMSLPNADTCALVWQSANDPLMKRLSACRSESVGSSLPYRAIARNDIHGFLVELDAISQEECEAFIEAALKSPNTKATLVVPCARK